MRAVVRHRGERVVPARDGRGRVAPRGRAGFAPGEWGAVGVVDRASTLLGTRQRRLDADDKVTGYARYASDITLPGMLVGKILRSERPHARIVRIDTGAAEALAGVEAVVTGAEPLGWFGELVKDQRAFAVD